MRKVWAKLAVVASGRPSGGSRWRLGCGFGFAQLNARASRWRRRELSTMDKLAWPGWLAARWRSHRATLEPQANSNKIDRPSLGRWALVEQLRAPESCWRATEEVRVGAERSLASWLSGGVIVPASQPAILVRWD